VEGFDAADLELVSSKSLAEEQKGVGDLEDESQFRVLEGYGTLMEYLRRIASQKRIQFLFNAPVYAIQWRKSHVLIRCMRAGRSKSYSAARCIITLPIGVLARDPNEVGAIQFMPDIGDKRRAMSGLTMGPVVKVILQFKEPFWHNHGAIRTIGEHRCLSDVGFIHDLAGPFPTWWTARPMEAGLLTAWAGGRKAVALKTAAVDTLVSTAVSSLARIFGIRTKILKSAMVAAHTHDWQADVYSGGAYSYVNVGGMRSRSLLGKPLDRTLYFAGEATDTKGQASTVAGAIASGRRAANEILSKER